MVELRPLRETRIAAYDDKRANATPCAAFDFILPK